MENQNTNEPDGYELLKEVIESNRENASKSTEFAIEQRNTNEFLKGVLFEIKQSETIIKNSVNSLPQSIVLVNSQETQEAIDGLRKNLQKKTIREYFALIIMILALLIMIVVLTLSKQWYSESIRTKNEIRRDVLNEIKANGQAIYKVQDYEQLQQNTDVINKWMKKNPKDAEKFLRFKDGYESR